VTQEEWVVVASARDDYEAQLITGRLSQVGIESNVLKSGSALGAGVTGVQNPWEPVSVLVPRHQADAARDALDDFLDADEAEAKTLFPSASNASVVIVAIVVAAAMVAAFIYSVRFLF
jgi:hypothetical protein